MRLESISAGRNARISARRRPQPYAVMKTARYLALGVASNNAFTSSGESTSGSMRRCFWKGMRL